MFCLHCQNDEEAFEAATRCFGFPESPGGIATRVVAQGSGGVSASVFSGTGHGSPVWPFSPSGIRQG